MTRGPHSRTVLALLGMLLLPALHATPMLRSGLWRYDIHILSGGHNTSTHTLEHCYKKPRLLKPDTPKGCEAPALHVQGTTARWVVACTLANGMVHIRSRGIITYLDRGNAFQESSVSQITMPTTGTRVFQVRMTGRRLGACPKG